MVQIHSRRIMLTSSWGKMSGTAYLVEFAGQASSAIVNKALSILREISKEMELSRKARLANLGWTKAEKMVNSPILDVNKPIFEVTVSPRLTSDVNVSREILRVSPIDDKSLHVVITDASLPPKKCEEIALEFAKTLYEKTTGEKIDDRMIHVEKVATLSERICEHCLQVIEGFPYVCKACGRTFCYDHRQPESHGCRRQPHIIEEANTQYTSSSPVEGRSEEAPKIIIRRVPCG